MKKHLKKYIALMLTMIMLVNILPVSAFASSAEEGAQGLEPPKAILQTNGTLTPSLPFMGESGYYIIALDDNGYAQGYAEINDGIMDNNGKISFYALQSYTPYSLLSTNTFQIIKKGPTDELPAKNYPISSYLRPFQILCKPSRSCRIEHDIGGFYS